MIKDTKSYTFGIIGAGKVGITLGIELLKLGRLDWIVTNSKASGDRVKKTLINPDLIRTSVQDIDHLPNMIIIVTNDSVINEVARKLAEKYGKFLKGVQVIHCSGVLGTSVLEPCSDNGASVAAIHPFQTFYLDTPNLLHDIRWGIECTDEDYSLYSSFVDLLYGFPIRLSEESVKEKALYHAVATSASNYMTTIIQLANQIADSANIDSNEFLPTIAKTTLGNNLRGLTDSKSIPLTGPIARADVNTIRLHVKAMKGHRQLLRPYCYMGLATNEMALNAGVIDKSSFLAIQNAFREGLED